MMHILIGISDEIGDGLRLFLSDRIPGDRVRGAFLDVDDYWLDSYSLISMRRYSAPWLEFDDLPHHTWQELRRIYDIEVRKDWRPPDWNRHCKWSGYPTDSSPFFIRVIFRRPEDLRRENLPVAYEGHPIVYEYRPPNLGLSLLRKAFGNLVGWVLPQDSSEIPKPLSIGCEYPNKTAGTLCSVLRSPSTNQRYLVSCAHVLGAVGNSVYSPGPYEGRAYQKIGEVTHSVFPPLKIPGEICQADHNFPATKMDLAVAKIAEESELARSINWVLPVRSARSTRDVAKKDSVMILGKVSGCVQARIGALSIWDEVHFHPGAVESGARCFVPLFELKSARRQYVIEDLVKGGDSGACVVSRFGDSYSWDGMLVSGDGGQAYACFAEYVLDECNSSSLFPGGLALSS